MENDIILIKDVTKDEFAKFNTRNFNFSTFKSYKYFVIPDCIFLYDEDQLDAYFNSGYKLITREEFLIKYFNKKSKKIGHGYLNKLLNKYNIT